MVKTMLLLLLFNQSLANKMQANFDQASRQYKSANENMMNQKLTSKINPEAYTASNSNQPNTKVYYDNSDGMDAEMNRAFLNNPAAQAVKQNNTNNKVTIDGKNPAYRQAVGYQANANTILSDKGERYGCTEVQGQGSQKTATETCQVSNVYPLSCVRYPDVKIIDVPYQAQASYSGQLSSPALRTGVITPPETGIITSATVQLENHGNNIYRCKRVYQGFIAGHGMSTTWPDCGFGAGGLAPFRLNNTNIPVTGGKGILFELRGGEAWGVSASRPWTIHMNVTRYTKEAEITWKDACQNVNQHACIKTNEQCVEKGGTRNIGGVNVTQDCWKQHLDHTCGYHKVNNCDKLAQTCNFVSQQCIEEAQGFCFTHERTYHCTEKVPAKKELVCGNVNSIQFKQTLQQGSQEDFLKATTAFAGVMAAADSAKGKKDVEIFKGQGFDCGEGAMGVYDCCGGSGNFIHRCSENEKKLQKAREKGLATFVGRYCGNKILGVCVAHRQGWCVFDSKLSRIVQEQGRAKQLHMNFGSGEHLNCQGISPEQLQHIDFSQVNFKEFYEDIQSQATLPKPDIATSLSTKFDAKQTMPDINADLNHKRNQVQS